MASNRSSPERIRIRQACPNSGMKAADTVRYRTSAFCAAHAVRSASTTLAAITGGGAGCENATKNAVASLAARLAEVAADVLDVKKLVNAMIDDDQALGWKQ